MMHTICLQIGLRHGSLPRALARFASLVTILGTVLAGLASPAAEAGIMTVYSCRTPSGRYVAAEGWTKAAYHNGSPHKGVRGNDTCSHGPDGSLYASVPGSGAESELSQEWAFGAAPDTEIVKVSLAMCARAYGPGGSVSVRWEGPTTSYPVSLAYADKYSPEREQIGCFRSSPYWADIRNYVTASGISAQKVYVVARGYGAVPNEYFADFHISSFRADIRDDFAPRVYGVHGPLITNLEHTGTETMTFSAEDTGVGVFRAVAEARIRGIGTWREVASATVARGSCIPVRETTRLYEFGRPRPCPLTVEDSRLTLNNDELGPGDHVLRVVVEDAAGNRTDAVPPHQYTVPRPKADVVTAAAPPAAPEPPAATAPAPPIGAGASRAAELQITVPKRRRMPTASPFRLSGRLLNSESHPIAGASLLIRARPFLPKPGTPLGAWGDVGEVVTDANGVFQARMPAGASRSLLVSYRANAGDTEPTATAVTNVVVPAQIAVRPRRSRVRNGKSVVFRGKVAGPIPEGGVLVALEVREPERWVPVATTRRWVRTTPTGSFRLSYRFRRTFRPSTYQFRVVADEDSAFQYTRGVSRTIPIRVRP